MPRVKNISAGRYYHRGTGHLSAGDTADVSEELAEYLCEECGGFALVEELPEPDDLETVDSDIDIEWTDTEIADAIESGKCPWCDEYEGENVGMHASSAHSDAWDDYKED